MKLKFIFSKVTGCFLLLILFLLQSGNGTSQTSEYEYRISPYVRNIKKEEHKGTNQSWSISQGIDGTIYVANRTGLLEYNGTTWNQYPMNSNHPLRSVLATDDGLIYYGHFQDFGYFKRNAYGKLVRYSISDSLVSPEIIANENIWSINKIGEKIYFRSFGKIYVYNGESVHVISPNQTVFSLFEMDGEPYINIIPEGIFLINDLDDLQQKAVPDFIRDKRIINVLTLSDGQELVITEFNGLFLKQRDSYKPWNCPANKLLKKYQLNKSVIVNENKIAIGTIGYGVIIISREGEIINVLDKINGLQNNTVLALLTDIHQNLWICLDKGIDYAEINSPFLYCLDRPGSLGSVYSAAYFKGKLYVGTNQGLFCTDWNAKSFINNIRFKKIEEARGQVWDLKIIDDKLFCNYNLGLLQIDETKILQIGDLGGFTVVLHPDDDNIFYQGNYIGILQFKKGPDGNWHKGKWINEDLGGARFLQIDELNNLWVGQSFINAFLFRLNAQNDSILSSRKLGNESGFNQRWNVGVFNFENRITFSNYNQYFTYDFVSESVKPYDWLNEQLGEYRSARFMYNTDKNEYCFLLPDRLAIFDFDGSNLKLQKEIKHTILMGSSIDDRQNIWRINTNQYIIGLDNGLMIYNKDLEKSVAKNTILPLKLVEASCSNEKSEAIGLEVNNISSYEIPFRYKNMVFNFAIAGNLNENYSVSYKLDTDDWLDNGVSKSVTFNYLRSGNHLLKVKAVDQSQQLLSEKEIAITILPPWYLNRYSITVYILLLLLTVYLIRVFNLYRLKKQKLAYLKKIKSDNTRRIIRMKNQHLRTEVQTKSTQLVNYTVLLKNKNEVLAKIKELLSKTVVTQEHSRQSINKIYNIIEKNISDKNDWQMFNTHFDEAHSNFLKKIKHKHEVLTQADLQLCAFLKMNLSSKEIASLLTISIRSVEVKRYRLRKKLELLHDENLVEYLMEI